LYVSEHTLTTIYHPTPQNSSFQFLFRLHPGVNEEQARLDVLKAFGARYTLQMQSLTSNSTALINLTVFFGCYLVLGLIFGALALGVIMSRAVVERRQHIGMLRAFGFSRALVMNAFLMEVGFIVTLSLVIGTALALWSAYQFTGSQYASFPVPVPLMVAILLGCYLVAFLATALPTRKATHIQPGEALRIE
ncbi:MAG: FtsX-like permease family protein, partial [Ktedonobacteraceae bacterium]|nr:FtsX-like permease family protein [Ktedonobacteraceae bacterium]